MVSHTTKTIVTFVTFKWNQTYIASTFCENKEDITLKCDGKCYLRKQIKKQQESKDTPLTVKKGQFLDLFIPQEDKKLSFVFSRKPLKVIKLVKNTFFEYSELHARLLVTRMFRPPSCF